MHPLPPEAARSCVVLPPLDPPSPVTTERMDAVANALYEKGWCLVEDFLPADLTAALIARAAHLQAQNLPIQAGIGREDQHRLNGLVREAAIHWLGAANPTEAVYLGVMDDLRRALNRRLFLGLFEFESHFAFYAPGGFYARHLDALKGARNRMVSVVTYLNTDWRSEDGGELVVWGPEEDAPEVARVLPKAGTAIVFLSEEIPHAVEATHRPRLALPGWFRVNASRADRIDPPL